MNEVVADFSAFTFGGLKSSFHVSLTENYHFFEIIEFHRRLLNKKRWW